MDSTSSSCRCPGKGIARLVSGLAVAIAIVAASYVASAAYLKGKTFDRTISTTGSAERVIESDTAKWTTSFSRSVEPAMLKEGTAQLTEDTKAVIATLKRQGVKDGEITLQPINVASVCENMNSVAWDKFGGQICGKIASYSIQQGIVVESTDAEKVRTLSQTAPSAFVAQGMVFTGGQVEYFYSKLADLKLDMMQEAAKNAKDRADRITSATGGKAGGIRTATMGVFQVSAVNSMDVSDSGVYDTSAFEKKVTAIVRGTFALE